MYIMYIDEAGDTIPLSQKGKKFLVLTGCVIEDKNIRSIEQKLRDIKEKYYKNPDIEIKSNYLRYANPDITNISSPLKLHARDKYNELEDDITNFLKDIPVSLIAIAIDKEVFWEENPSQNPYDTAYIMLLQQYHLFLEEKQQCGICIIDPREGTVVKKLMDKQLDKIHHKMRWSFERWQKSPLIIERLLFATSDNTVGIQIADLYCYPIFHMLEYNCAKGEYWRFDETSWIKLHRFKNQESKVNFVFHPQKTKNGLKLFR